MEYYQTIQNRAAETAAVIKENVPTMAVTGITAAGLIEKSQGLGARAQARDDALAAFDAANNAESQGYLALKALTIVLPRIAQAELDDANEAESALLDLLAQVVSISPRKTERAVQRGKKLVSALTLIDDYLTGLLPARAPVAFAGKGLPELSAAIDAQSALAQALEDRRADVATARSLLQSDAAALDRINKRFYSALTGAARGDAKLTKALAQIDTGAPNLPGTLSIRTVLQGGADNRQVLISYLSGTYDESATSTVEWRIVGVDAAFAHTVTADPSGNALGPFAQGATVQLRTRVANGSGATTGSVRTLVIV